MGNELDLLIVGAGPAGLSVASRLPTGMAARVVHQDREIGEPVRTSGGSWLSDMHKLGIPDKLFHLVRQAEILSDNRRFNLSLEDDPVVILDVTGLYKWLAGQVSVPVSLATKFLSASPAKGGYLCQLRGPEGPEVVWARQIIDASGWHMAVLASLGLALSLIHI